MFDKENNFTKDKSENNFSIVETTRSGVGMVAARNILAGDIIIREKPVIVIPPQIKSSQYTWKEKVQYLENVVSCLPEADRSKFFNLHDCKKLTGSVKSVEGIFRTNNFALGPLTATTAHGVFLLASRINHSCWPSCEVVWREDSEEQEVVAIRDIEEGEELTICYLNIKDRMKTPEERRKVLLPYGFTCSCRFCVEEEDTQEVRRFQEISRRLEERGEVVRLCMEMENILERVGAKLVWRISNLEMAAAAINKEHPNEEIDEYVLNELERKLEYLCDTLYKRNEMFG